MLWSSHLTMGQIYSAMGDVVSTIEELTRAGHYFEQVGDSISIDELRIGFFSDSQEIYRELVDAYYTAFEETQHSSMLDSLLVYYEKGRSRSLKAKMLSQFGGGGSAKFDLIKDELSATQRNRRLREESNNYEPELINEQRLEALRLSLLGHRLYLDEVDPPGHTCFGRLLRRS